MNLHEKRNERTCATWTRRDRLAAPVATAMSRIPRARTWPTLGQSSTTEAFTWEWARWRSASARWSTRAWSLASTSSSSRTPSATTLCSPSRRPPGWRSSSYRCTLYFSTTRWVHLTRWAGDAFEILTLFSVLFYFENVHWSARQVYSTKTK